MINPDLWVKLDDYSQRVVGGLLEDLEPSKDVPVFSPGDRRGSERSNYITAFHGTVVLFATKCVASKAYNKLSPKGQNEVFSASRGGGVFSDDLPLEWTLAQLLQNMEEDGRILANFGGNFRWCGGASIRNYWVIEPDGSFRQPTGLIPYKFDKNEGEKIWRIVGEEELAITFVDGKYHAPGHYVNHVPPDGATPAQKVVVAEIAAEISQRWGNPNGWIL